MAEELSFSNNYTDVSQQYGTGAGFQFEFYCECCRDTWRSPFEPYRSAQAAGWLQRMGGVASSFLGSAGNVLDEAAEGYARAGWGNARDEAFRQAIEHAKSHFHRCAKCHDYACDKCFSTESGLCNRCAPDLAAEVSAARHDGLLTQARDNAREVGVGRAAKVDVATDQAVGMPRMRDGNARCEVLSQLRACAEHGEELRGVFDAATGGKQVLSGVREGSVIQRASFECRACWSCSRLSAIAT